MQEVKTSPKRNAEMITVAEAKRLVKEHTPKSRHIRLPLATAVGRTLAEDLIASEPSPPFTNSAMDGAAIGLAGDMNDTSVVKNTFRIVGESAAGKPFVGKIHTGEAVKISTGAPLPEGADTVIPLEDYSIEGDKLSIHASFKHGQWVRRQGQEYSAGACLLRSGEILRPAQIALAAQLGYGTLAVYDAPRAALLATGSEIIPHQHSAHKRGEGKIFDANTPMLQAALHEAGAELVFAENVSDSLEATVQALSRAMAEADLICTTGGVSVGEHDYIKQAAQMLGFKPIFWRVRQKPGKPLFFAVKTDDNGRTTLLFGLPGNPVSTLMCFLHYVRPIISSMLGKNERFETVQAQMSESLVNTGGRAEFLRVRLEYSPKHALPSAVPLPKQDSFMLTSLTGADGFVFLDIDAEIFQGAPIDVMRL